LLVCGTHGSLYEPHTGKSPARIPSANSTIAPLSDLLLRRHHEMRRGRLVGRAKHLVCVNSAAVQFAPETLIAWKNLFPALSISVCLLETGYPIFIWLGKTRTFYLVAIITMHLAIGLAMGLYLFALVMITLNFAASGPDFGFSREMTNASRQMGAPPAPG
jgi:hypothetical protein